jgi:DNA end-binding protein Ku
VYFAKSYNLEPADAPTSKPFSLLRATMERESMVAIIEYKGSGRDKLGAIRVTPAGLMLHELYYAAEVRAFSSKTWKPDIQLSEAEHRAAAALLQQFRTEWTPEAYVNKYNARAAALIQSKQDGQVIEVQAPTRPTAKVVDLADALTQSLALRSAKAADVDAPKPAVPVKAGKTKKGRAA